MLDKKRTAETLDHYYQRLLDAESRQYHNELVAFFRRISEMQISKEIIDSTLRKAKDFDSDAWLKEHTSLNGGEPKLYPYELPIHESQQVKIVWTLMERCFNGNVRADNIAWSISRGTSHDNSRTTEEFISIVYKHLLSEITYGSQVAYLLGRYKRRFEWFDQSKLWKQYEEHEGKGKAEDIYDDDLRKFLFDQGVEHPFSQPKSASGRADIVGNLDTLDPLILEVKLFDNESRNKSYLGAGLNQALAYANDYHKESVYLVVFNVTERTLQFPNEGTGLLPLLYAGNKTVHVLAIQAKPLPSASKRGKLETVLFTKEDLLGKEEPLPSTISHLEPQVPTREADTVWLSLDGSCHLS